MSFSSQHYHCCANTCGDATVAKQDALLAAVAAVAVEVAAFSGDASAAKQDEILSEIDKLGSGLRTY